MGDLDDNFARLLGQQPSDKDRQDLYRVRDVLRVKTTDSVWLLFMALQYYEKLYEEFPAQIADAARQATKGARTAAEAEIKAAQAVATRALADAVRHAAVKAARDAAEADRAKWVSIATGVLGVLLLLVGWRAFVHGQETGRAVGENKAKRECAALVALSSWAITPEGQLAYGLAKVGALGDLARCTGRGMVAREGWCAVPSERGRPLARWPLPPTLSRNEGGSP